uniref:Uncharacterized protein n=1 Tax=Moniliophthora roreri TaxID=221103 RepID=A0A0W0FMW9_MONRR
MTLIRAGNHGRLNILVPRMFALLSTSRISVDVNADYVPGAGQKKGIERVEAMVFLDKMQAVAGFQNDLEAIKVVARYANVRLFSFVPKDK